MENSEYNSKWLMFKNFLHNELGVTKEDIRNWIEEAVQKEAEKHVKQTFSKFSVQKYIEKKIDKELYENPYGQKFTKAVSNVVKDVISSKFQLLWRDDARD